MKGYKLTGTVSIIRISNNAFIVQRNTRIGPDFKLMVARELFSYDTLVMRSDANSAINFTYNRASRATKKHITTFCKMYSISPLKIQFALEYDEPLV